jgi:hypothetical protein
MDFLRKGCLNREFDASDNEVLKLLTQSLEQLPQDPAPASKMAR